VKVLKTILAFVLVAAFVSVGVWGYPRVAARLTWVAVTARNLVSNEAFTSIAVAAVNLSPGMQIGRGMVVMRRWRRDQAPEGAIFNLEGLRGKFARERVAKGQHISPQQVTDVVPPPMRTTPRRGYFISSFAVPVADASRLFLGDRVDLTIQYIDISQTPMVIKEPVTLRVGWEVHHIDYSSPLRERQGRIPVYVEFPHRDWYEHFGQGVRWRGGHHRMFKSER